MILGVDFDNTIVCYDGLFHRFAVERGLIPPTVPPAKNAVRDYLRQIGQEDRWTELQGYVYGPGMREARLFHGVPEFFDHCRRLGHDLYIISHRTRFPFLGPRYDLHQAARDFLARHGFDDPTRIALPSENIRFFETKQEKIAEINAIGCTHFIDDLPEILAAADLAPEIERILFDPNGEHADRAGMRRAASWEELDGLLAGARSTGFSRNAVNAPPEGGATIALLAAAGFSGEFHLASLSGGGNNRVYRVDCEGGPLLLKAYFHHPLDPRDRLGAEFGFSRFAWEHGVRSIPRPLARDDQNHFGLYEFIEGSLLSATDVGAAEVDRAAAFFIELNRHKHDAAAAAISPASEACFTIAEHLACVERRVERLANLRDREAAAWVQESLAPKWRRVEQCVKRQAAQEGLRLDEPLSPPDRCLSPSDFGFHNAIRAADGRLRFIDFEYAGWDDPAKTVCDFLCQPRVPVPAELTERFTMAVLESFHDAEHLRRRVDLLLPVYRLKWCCIMMNDFLPVDGRRRSFAQEAANVETRKRQQLEKSARALQCIEA